MPGRQAAISYCPYSLPEPEEIPSPQGPPWPPTHHPQLLGDTKHSLAGDQPLRKPQKRATLATKLTQSLSPGHLEEGGESRGGWRKTRPTPSAHPPLRPGRSGSSRHRLFCPNKAGFFSRWPIRGGMRTPEPGPARHGPAPARAEPSLQGSGAQPAPSLRDTLPGLTSPGLSSPAALRTPQGAQAELGLSAARLGCPFLSTISSSSPSQTCETPLLSCSHPRC